MTKISDLFEVNYGTNLELNSLKHSITGINFVSRTAKNNGVSAKVKLLPHVVPLPAGILTVAGGGSVLETFLQTEAFYSGRDLYYLVPKFEMTTAQKLFYCECIRANKYRYSYGRQANRTLGSIPIPSILEIPDWVDRVKVDIFNNASAASNTQTVLASNPVKWSPFIYKELFKIERGRGPRRKDLNGLGTTPFITSTDSSNGVSGYTDIPPIHSGNVISVNRNGSVGEAFYQPLPFCSTEDVHIFTPNFILTPEIGLFLVTLIRREKYRFNYGRKWGIERMQNSIINLPVDEKGIPDWQYMENYIKTLPYSSQIT